MHQFEISRLSKKLEIFGFDATFTNSSLFMVIAVVLIFGFLTYAMNARGLVPNRVQSIAELIYEFVANMIRENVGTDGMKYFPFVFTLFIFILACNMLGMIPGTFTVTSHIIITAAMALLVFFTVIVYGFYKNGLKFFKLFVPSGIPIYILPLIVFIEVLSFLSRPISHSVCLRSATCVCHFNSTRRA